MRDEPVGNGNKTEARVVMIVAPKTEREREKGFFLTSPYEIGNEGGVGIERKRGKEEEEGGRTCSLTHKWLTTATRLATRNSSSFSFSFILFLLLPTFFMAGIV